MRIAFADPPYPGMARRHYGPDAKEVNHRVLIGTLEHDYPDGWALSTGARMLQDVLALCPPGVRVAAWVKTFAAYKPNVHPTYAWEPVILRGGRTRRAAGAPIVVDWLACSITTRRGVVGAKPDPFWFWLFALLGLRPDDQFDDLFPGSGAGDRAWQAFVRQRPLLAPDPLAEAAG